MENDILKPTVAFDVDDTLVDNDGSPNEDVIQFFKLFQKFGCDMYIWSNGGEAWQSSTDYAKHVRDQLGLTAKVVEKGSFKPDVVVDDLDIYTRVSERTIGAVNIKV